MIKTKKHSLFSKIISAVLAVSMLVTATIGLGSTSASAASAKIFSDDKATVVLHDDGSGTIYLNKEFDKKNPLTEIAGIPLKEIITFKNGGYIDKFYTEYLDNPCCDISDIIVYLIPHIIRVHGRGPSGLGSGNGYLHFTDKTNDTYDLKIWTSSEKWHYVGYDSDDSAIVKISWNS